MFRTQPLTPAEQWRQDQEQARTGMVNKMAAGRNFTTNDIQMPVLSYQDSITKQSGNTGTGGTVDTTGKQFYGNNVDPAAQQTLAANPNATTVQKSAPSKQQILLDLAKKKGIDIAIKTGAEQGGKLISGQINGDIKVQGVMPDGNLVMTDGGIATPEGKVVKPGAGATDAVKYGAALLAAVNIYRTLTDKKASNADKAVGVTSAAATGASAFTSGGLSSALGAGASILTGGYQAGKILASDMTGDQKAREIKHTVADSAAAYYTFGLSALAQFADRKFLGGQSDKLRNKVDDFEESKKGMYLNPGTWLVNKGLGKAFGMMGGTSKGKDQGQRDAIRKVLVERGLIKGGDDYNLNFKDGSKFDIGMDGGAKLTNEAGQERSYQDVDLADKRSGVAIAHVAPIAAIMGLDKDRAQDFTGYFTNATLNGGADDKTSLARARELYDQNKIDQKTALARIDELSKLDPEKGGIDAGTANVYRANINEVFGGAPVVAQAKKEPVKTVVKKPELVKKKPSMREAAPKTVREVIPEVTPPPQVIEPDDTQTPEEVQSILDYRTMLENMARRRSGYEA